MRSDGGDTLATHWYGRRQTERNDRNAITCDAIYYNFYNLSRNASYETVYTAFLIFNEFKTG